MCGVKALPARTSSAVTNTTFAPAHCFLVMGTDTDVGKTHICAALSLTLLDAGHRVVACKPVETGIATTSSDDDRNAVGSDLQVVERACAAAPAGRIRYVHGARYPLPAAPTAAARAAGVRSMSAAEAAALVRSVEDGADAVVVETCGAAMTPLSDTDVMSDLATLLPDYLPIIVAGLRLGVLSHTIAAVECLRSRGARRMTVVLNDRYTKSPASFTESVRYDLRLRGIETLTVVPHGARPHEVDLTCLLNAAAP